MTRTVKAFTPSLFGAGLALALLTPPAGAQDAGHWLNEASDCEIFRALNDVVPAACAQPGDTVPGAVRTRGLKTRGIVPRTGPMLEQPTTAVTRIDGQAVAAVEQANPPATKAINARVQFEFDSFRLSDDAKAMLDRLAGVLNDGLMQDKMIEIEGHADAVGPAGYNLQLSQLRARAVRAYLIQAHGIAPERLPFVGRGESEPYDPLDPTAAINRRVVFTNLTG